jgi:hypothetical protein
MSGIIFSLFEPTFRMASIEVLDYWKDGEVEARRVTGRILRRDGRFPPWGPLGSVHQPSPPSAEGGAILAILDRWGEPIRRHHQFNLPQPDRGQRAGGHPDQRPQPDRQQRYHGE